MTRAPGPFASWIEIFKAGDHLDSQGNYASYSRADLDQIVANHSAADAAPIVIGHPKSNDPAWGWTAELKREGESLFFRARDVEPAFEEAVQKGRYRKRSVRLAKTEQGWKLKHIGFLGAKPPAIDGLAALNFSDEGEHHDFEADLYTPNILAGMMRRMREFLIEKFSLEEADRVMPDWDISSLADHATRLSEAQRAAQPASYSHHDPKGDPTMGDFTQADLDAAVANARADERSKVESDFSAKEKTLQEQLSAERRSNRARDYQALVDKQIDAGKLTPAQAGGAVDFMLSLDAEQEFEFEAHGGANAASAGSAGAASGAGGKAGRVKTSPVQWFHDFMQALPQQVDMSQSRGDGVGELNTGDAQAISDKAVEFQQSEAKAGRTISISQAVSHVTKGAK